MLLNELKGELVKEYDEPLPSKERIGQPHLATSVGFQHVHRVFVCVYRRKINFAQFQEALKLFAEKKYPGDADGLEKLKAKIFEGKGPATSGTTVSLKKRKSSLPICVVRRRPPSQSERFELLENDLT